MTARWMTRWNPAVGLESSCALADQVFEFAFEVGRQAAPQLVEIDIAGPHHGGGILVVDQREQQVLERGVFVMPLVGERQRAMQGLFKVARESGHVDLVPLFDPYMGPALLLFHHTLERMLVFARKVHHLGDFGFGNLVCVDAALADVRAGERAS